MQATNQSKKMPGFSLLSRDERDAAYLLRRAGFGAPPQEVKAAAARGLGKLANYLVDYEQISDTFSPPPDAILVDRRYSGSDLAMWWLNLMIASPRQLQEKMTLFWHGHFATGIPKVGSTKLMYQQNQLFRTLALGRFDDILSAVYKDPAMLVWLDGQRNTKIAPNENWGREVMELFTLGIGNYTEDDVHAMARAFTGWRVNREAASAVFVPKLHDTGSKTILGQTGNWDGEDAVRILAAHAATGPFLATKLWKFFASETPPASAVQKLEKVYYTRNHSIREMVRTLFTLPEFYASTTRTGHIKSPVEFVVGSIRQLGLTAIELKTLPRVLTFLGQELFNPPNVGGWSGGTNWINAATMLGRFNFASYLTGDNGKGVIDTASILDASGAQVDDAINRSSRAGVLSMIVSYVTETLGVITTASTGQALNQYASRRSISAKDLETTVRGLVHLALVSPEYQVS